jgi:polysaccharide export outer membrane protein
MKRKGIRVSSAFRIQRSTFALVPAVVCLALWLSGCAGTPVPTRTLGKGAETPDAYTKALQQAMIRQHLTRAQRDSGGYRIGPNDIIEIRVFEYDKMNTLARVGENGLVSLPPLGEVRAAGLTERELEAVLREKLRGKYLTDPHLTVFVKEPHAMEVAIVGEVTKPGRYSLLGERRLVDLLAEAGGLTEKAGSVAYVVRFEQPGDRGTSDLPTTAALGSDPSPYGFGTKSIKIPLDALLLRGEEQWNLVLKSGDLINIPEAGWVHVTGAGVQKPGTYPLTRTAKTVRQIIDEAGGLKFEASKKMRLVRKTEEGREEVLPVDYRKVLRDKSNDAVLRAGDQVVTDRTAIKTALATIGKGIERVFHIGMYGSYAVPLGP